MIPAEHIERAKDDIAHGQPEAATAHALIAIAELLATNMTNTIIEATTNGALATAEAFGSVLGAVNPGTTAPQCPPRSSGGRRCIVHNWGEHGTIHHDEHGWTWREDGERAFGPTAHDIESAPHDCEYDDPNKCGWPGHRR